MGAKFLAVSAFALGLFFQPAAVEASVVQLPLNGNVTLESSGGLLTVGIDDIQISGFPTFDLSNLGEFTFAYAWIQANFTIVDSTGSSIDSLSGSNSLSLEFDNCPFCHHPPVPQELTYLLPVGQFELDITSSSEGHSNSGSTVQIGFEVFASSDAVAAVPEPSTWTMMLLGFCGLGFLTLRRCQRLRVT
ncbi:MAG TPA: PEP-CTERM sorting domain-containing protein [Bryobacteraceae bacterium]|nr:PEP-CTERM sorting domain-containing protein [Bryobacteraceae bacterium]